MNDTVLRARGVAVNRGGREVLAGVTLDVARGELVALMGPSGSGKTTLLRAVAALEPIAAGQIVVGSVVLDAGRSPAAEDRRALRRTVGLVFQFHHLFEHLSSVHNVWLAPVHAHGIDRAAAERRAIELLRAFGVEQRANAFPRELSGGEAQRVAIARALAVNPALLLMDEPTASLDPARRAELAALVRGLAQGGRAVVAATHDEDFARSCGARVLRIESGRIRESR